MKHQICHSVLSGLFALLQPSLAFSETFRYNDGMTRGQGYNSFSGKGLMTNVVTFGDKKIPKREIIAPVDNMSLPFTPPSADLTGLNATSYFLTPIDDTDEEDSWRQPLPRRGVASSAIHSRSAPPSTDCQGELWADVKKVQSYKQYLDHMEVNPAVALAGFGSSAEISGNYLDQTQGAENRITLLINYKVHKQEARDSSYRFNNDSYSKERFAERFGDKWIFDTQKGGKFTARVTIASESKVDQEKMKAAVNLVTSFFGAGFKSDVSFQKDMKDKTQNLRFDITYHYRGALGRSDVAKPQPTADSILDKLEEVNADAQAFKARACDHSFISYIIAEDYKTLRGFPDDQEIMDYSDAKRMAPYLLQSLVKASQLKDRLINDSGISQIQKDEIIDEYDSIEQAHKSWVDRVTAHPKEALQLYERRKNATQVEFLDKYANKYKSLLDPDPGAIKQKKNEIQRKFFQVINELPEEKRKLYSDKYWDEALRTNNTLPKVLATAKQLLKEACEEINWKHEYCSRS